MKNLDSISNNPRKIQAPRVQNAAGNPEPRAVSLLARPKKRGRFFLQLLVGVILLVMAVLGTLVIVRATTLSNKIFVGQKTSFFQKIKSVFTGGGSSRLAGEDEGQINILLLGIGGEGHDGPYLSDTIIVAQIRPEQGEISLTSIPRDYWVKMPEGNYYAKINNAFSSGFSKNKDWNEGGMWARGAAESVTGLRIPYFAVVDFAGFKKAIDRVGGVEVNVERTFTDFSFPNDKTLGYLPPVTFEAGPQNFNGERALMFARSRHAQGPEGSDFARGQRQQKIIQAFKDKVFKLNLISNAGTINQLLGIFADHFHTNISPEEMFHVYNLAREKGINNLVSLSLDQDTGLICPTTIAETGAYALVPCAGKNEQDIKEFFKNAFALGRLYQEKPVIWLGNSTKNLQLYRDADSRLKNAGLTVWEVPYSEGDSEPFAQNIFFQVNPKPATAEFIKNTLNAKELTLPPPGLKIDNKKVDIIVILGSSQ